MGVVFFPSLPFMGVMLFPSFVLGNASGEGDVFLASPSPFSVLLSLPSSFLPLLLFHLFFTSHFPFFFVFFCLNSFHPFSSSHLFHFFLFLLLFILSFSFVPLFSFFFLLFSFLPITPFFFFFFFGCFRGNCLY